MRNSLRRIAVLGATAGLAVSASLTAATGASAAPDDRSGRWLVGQLDDGIMYNSQFDYDDYGLTADAGTALMEIGGRRGALAKIRTRLQQGVDEWTTFDGDVYAGSTAKALAYSVSSKSRPRDFGGVNLVRRTAALVSSQAPIKGRIQDRSDGTDYANTIGQAFAVQGLRSVGHAKSRPALRFLLKQQCEAGYFRLGFAAADEPKQACDAGAAEESTPNTDATSLALLSLHRLPRKTKAVRQAIVAGTRWLASEQREDGSLGGGPGTEAGSNTNSTGLAAWAMGEQGRCRDARQAARWVEGLALGNGALAYDQDAYDTAQDGGIQEGTRDQFRRATAQAAPGLQYLNLRACRG